MSNLELKEAGRKFWDANPCGGNWASFKEKVEWVLGTEDYVYELLTDELLDGKRVLEVGCGQGMALALASQKCNEVVGSDISENSLRAAEKGIEELGLKNVKLILRDAENLQFNNNEFDVIYSLGVLHHTPDIYKAVDEIYRVLKPGGKVIIMLYKKYNPKWLVVVIVRFFSKIIDFIKREKFYIANKLRKRYEHSDYFSHGTALLELFGCPVLRMYSKTQVKRMFGKFKNLKMKTYQTGFSRLFDFMPKFLRNKYLYELIKKFDRAIVGWFGFYLVIRGEK